MKKQGASTGNREWEGLDSKEWSWANLPVGDDNRQRACYMHESDTVSYRVHDYGMVVEYEDGRGFEAGCFRPNDVLYESGSFGTMEQGKDFVERHLIRA